MLKVFAVLLGTFIWSSFAQSKAACQDEWNNVLERYDFENDFLEMKEVWLELESSCNKSDYYYLNLGHLFVKAADFDKANNAYLKGRELSGKHIADLELGIVDLYFQRATRRGVDLDEALLKTANLEMEKFISKHSNHIEGLAAMSGIKLVLKEFDSSVEYAVKAVEIEDNAVAYRHMAISYSRLRKAEETVVAAGKAIGLKSSLAGDRDLMLAASMAYYELGRIELAYGTMQLLIEANPDLKGDPLVNRIGASLQSKFNQMK